MNPNLTLMLVFLAILAWPVARWLEERRRRKLAFHRLMMARAVTQMERLMRDGQIKLGETCHDQVYGIMLRAQFLECFPVKVLPRSLTEADYRFREQLSDELARGTPAAKPIRLFVDSFMDAFRTERPMASRYFTVMTFMQWLVHQALPQQPAKRSREGDFWVKAKTELVVRSTHAPELQVSPCGA